MSRTASHQELRQATAADHERVDARFSGFDLGERAAYGRFLSAHAAAVAALEPALTAAGFADALPDWPARQRLAALQADLAALALPLPQALPCPPLDDAGSLWGAGYVLEGSRLGGAVLARRVAGDLPHSYLGGAQPAGAWPRFLQALDLALQTPDAKAAAIRAAKAAFTLFETAARQQLEPTPHA